MFKSHIEQLVDRVIKRDPGDPMIRALDSPKMHAHFGEVDGSASIAHFPSLANGFAVYRGLQSLRLANLTITRIATARIVWRIRQIRVRPSRTVHRPIRGNAAGRPVAMAVGLVGTTGESDRQSPTREE